MTDDIAAELAAKFLAAPVVPLIEADDPATAVRIANALQAGGLDVVEVVLRTDAALDCMAAIVQETSGIIVGAGTVLTVEQAKAVAERGAQFVVSPGLVDDVARFCIDKNLPFFAGTMTAGEVLCAWPAQREIFPGKTCRRRADAEGFLFGVPRDEVHANRRRICG